MALAAPRAAAAEAMRRQPAALEGAVTQHCIGGVRRARGLVAAGADEKIGERQLVGADRAAQSAGNQGRDQTRHHAARKLAIWRGRRKRP